MTRQKKQIMKITHKLRIYKQVRKSQYYRLLAIPKVIHRKDLSCLSEDLHSIDKTYILQAVIIFLLRDIYNTNSSFKLALNSNSVVDLKVCNNTGFTEERIIQV